MVNWVELDFESLDTFDADFGLPVLADGDLTVSAVGLLKMSRIDSSTPLGTSLPAVELKFESVVRSTRTIYEYVDNPKQNKLAKPYTVEDIDLSRKPRKKVQRFELEGVLTTLNAWAEWRIDAIGVYIRLTKS